jgi:hypothetical protein
VLGCAGSVSAQAELVLLLVPQTPDPALVELFHRVEAELRLHDFRPEVLVASPEDSTESLLGAQASAQRAFAAIAISEQSQFAKLHVWIVDSRTGLTREYKVEQQGGQEPTNVVAVRAVDLLRANRAPPPSAAAAPPAAADAEAVSAESQSTSTSKPKAGVAKQEPRAATSKKPSAAAQAELESDEPEELIIESPGGPAFQYKSTLLHLAAEVVGTSLGRRLSWSFGPSVGAWLTLAERWRIGIVGVVPLSGAVLHAPYGDAALTQELVWLELGARLLRAGSLQLSAAAGGGLHFLQAKGNAVSPYRSTSEATWSWTGSLAARADVMLSPSWSLGLTLRARVFLPPVEVAAQAEITRLATPALEGALGLSFWL